MLSAPQTILVSGGTTWTKFCCTTEFSQGGATRPDTSMVCGADKVHECIVALDSLEA